MILLWALGSVLVVAAVLWGAWRNSGRARERYAELQEKYAAKDQELAVTQAKLDHAHHTLQEQKQSFEQARQQLGDTFAALSKDALSSNSNLFMQMAQTSLEKVIAQAKGQWDKKEEALTHLVQPLKDTLQRYEVQTRSLAENSHKVFGTLQEQIRALQQSNHDLKKETGHLVSALKKPQVRGRWGEMTLKRTAELAGLVEHCDFFEQTSVQTEGGLQRPDMIVHLPDQRSIVIDAKVSLQAYLEALETTNDSDREQCLRRHAQHIVTHMKLLGQKSYWSQFESAPEFVVMFIPGESFFSVALEFEKSLIEDGINQKVILATPTTLIALLRAVSYGWRQEQLTKHALEISRLGSELYERLVVFVEHYDKVGRSLERATEAYNSSVGSLESRVLVSARKFKELGVSSPKDLSAVQLLEKRPKAIASEASAVEIPPSAVP